MPGFKPNQAPAPLTIGGKPWLNGCPGSLAERIMVAQARRWAWHTEGRFGVAVAHQNPVLVSAVESFVSGQMAAQTSQHRQEMERLKNG